MTKWIETTLGKETFFSKDRIVVSELDNTSYISTENMYENRGGISLSSGLPNVKSVCKFKRGDVLVSNIRPYFKKIWLADKDGGCSNDILVFKSENMDNKFLFYTLSQDYFFDFMMSGSKGAKMPRGDKDQIKTFPILFPESIEEQRAIAGVLSSLDDKIELLQQQNKTLEELAQTLFKHTFITNPNPQWKEESLDENINFLNGIAAQKYPAIEGEECLSVVKIAELKNGISAKTNKANKNVPVEYVVNNGDLLFSWSGSLFLTIWHGGEGLLNQHLFKVTSSLYSDPFCYFWIDHHLPWFKVIAASKAVTMGHIKRSHLKEAKIVVPDETTMQEFNSKVKPMFDKISENIKQIATLTQTRDTLLPKLISGEVKVKDIKNDS